MRSQILFGTLLTAAMVAMPTPAADLDVGQPFPEIVLPSIDGEPMSIAAFRGRKVALHVFASW